MALTATGQNGITVSCGGGLFTIDGHMEEVTGAPVAAPADQTQITIRYDEAANTAYIWSPTALAWEAVSAGGGSMTSFDIEDLFAGSETVTDGDPILFAGDDGVSVVVSSGPAAVNIYGVITFGAGAPPAPALLDQSVVRFYYDETNNIFYIWSPAAVAWEAYPSGSMSSFDITDSTNTETVSDSDTITYLGTDGIEITVGAGPEIEINGRFFVEPTDPVLAPATPSIPATWLNTTSNIVFVWDGVDNEWVRVSGNLHTQGLSNGGFPELSASVPASPATVAALNPSPIDGDTHIDIYRGNTIGGGGMLYWSHDGTTWNLIANYGTIYGIAGASVAGLNSTHSSGLLTNRFHGQFAYSTTLASDAAPLYMYNTDGGTWQQVGATPRAADLTAGLGPPAVAAPNGVSVATFQYGITDHQAKMLYKPTTGQYHWQHGWTRTFFHDEAGAAPGSPTAPTAIPSPITNYTRVIENWATDNILRFWTYDFEADTWGLDYEISYGAGGGGFTSFSITDGTTPQTINDGDTITFADGTGIDVVTSATDTVTVNLNASIDDLNDVDTTSSAPGVNDYLAWDGANWVPATPAASGMTSWTASDGSGTEAITDAETLLFTGDDGVSVVVSSGPGAVNITGVITFGAGAPSIPALPDQSVVRLYYDETNDIFYIWSPAAVAWEAYPNGSMSSFTITDGVTPQTIVDGDTITFVDGAGIDVAVSATDTVTVSLDASIDDLNDVDTTSVAPSLDDYLAWDGANWVPTTPAAGGMTSWTASDGSGTEAVTDSETLLFTGEDGVSVVVSNGPGAVNIYGVITFGAGAPATPSVPDQSVVRLYYDETNDIFYIWSPAAVAWEAYPNGSMSSFTITDGVTPQTVVDGDTITFADGIGINVATSATDTVTVSLDASIDDLTDVDTTSSAPSTGDHLEWNGANWVPATPPVVPDITKSLVVLNPVAADEFTFWYAENAMTISEMNAVLANGASTPSVTWTLRHSSDRSAAGNEVVTGGTTTTTTTTPQSITTFNDATVPAGSIIWIEITAQSGTVPELFVQMRFTED